jgi:hypothetical protein
MIPVSGQDSENLPKSPSTRWQSNWRIRLIKLQKCWAEWILVSVLLACLHLLCV